MSRRTPAGFIRPGYDPLKVPNAPTIGTATGGMNNLSVTFTAPSNVGGSAITGYYAVATKTSDGSQTTVTGSASPITITGLTSGTAYTVKVYAVNSYGPSAYSADSGSATPVAPPSVIGEAFGGGFYAGKINVSGTQYYLIVAPKASGENSARTWGPMGVTTGYTSVINGPTNSAGLAALGATYQAATFCEGLSIGGYTDWYLPAKNELEVLYYFLKPTTGTNDTNSGSNANAVSPEPVSTNYTTGSPAQTSATAFRTGNSEAFASDYYWSSTEGDSNFVWNQYFTNGYQDFYGSKYTNYYVRAVRRLPV